MLFLPKSGPFYPLWIKQEFFSKNCLLFKGLVFTDPLFHA